MYNNLNPSLRSRQFFYFRFGLGRSFSTLKGMLSYNYYSLKCSSVFMNAFLKIQLSIGKSTIQTHKYRFVVACENNDVSWAHSQRTDRLQRVALNRKFRRLFCCCCWCLLSLSLARNTLSSRGVHSDNLKTQTKKTTTTITRSICVYHKFRCYLQVI